MALDQEKLYAVLKKAGALYEQTEQLRREKEELLANAELFNRTKMDLEQQNLDLLAKYTKLLELTRREPPSYILFSLCFLIGFVAGFLVSLALRDRQWFS